MTDHVDDPEGEQDLPDPERGAELVRANLVATAVLGVVLAAGVAAPDSLGVVAAFVSLGYLLAGIIAFGISFFAAAERSRTEELSVAGLYCLAEGAPRRTRWLMLTAIIGQTVLSLTAAAIRPFTVLAFGTLAPMLGLGLAGVWSARHGVFRPRRR